LPVWESVLSQSVERCQGVRAARLQDGLQGELQDGEKDVEKTLPEYQIVLRPLVLPLSSA